MAEPYYIWRDAGFELTIATPKGGPVPVDPASESEAFLTPEAKKMQQDGGLVEWVEWGKEDAAGRQYCQFFTCYLVQRLNQSIWCSCVRCMMHCQFVI